MSKRKYNPGYAHIAPGGTLEYIQIIPSNKKTKALWKCFCGVIFKAQVNHIVKNNVKSCGCWRKLITEQKVKNPNLEYLQNIYANIKQRCYNKNNPAYKNYGNRGIIISNDWVNDGKKFAKDILDNLGNRPSNSHQLDRIDVNGNYELKNLRWTSVKENCRNKRNNKIVTINNQTKTISEWAEISGLNPRTISSRIKKGWSENKLLEPIKINKKIFDKNDFTGIFKGIKERCYNPNSVPYKDYGGRNINIYEPWKNNYQLFQQDILNSIGPRPSPKHQLDRYPNNNGNYESGNLRWATSKENTNNTRHNVLITINGDTKTISEWAEYSNISSATISTRLKLGWLGEKLLKPVFKRKLNDKEIYDLKTFYNEGKSIVYIAKLYKIGQGTVTDVIRNRGAYTLNEDL